MSLVFRIIFLVRPIHYLSASHSALFSLCFNRASRHSVFQIGYRRRYRCRFSQYRQTVKFFILRSVAALKPGWMTQLHYF